MKRYTSLGNIYVFQKILETAAASPDIFPTHIKDIQAVFFNIWVTLLSDESWLIKQLSCSKLAVWGVTQLMSWNYFQILQSYVPRLLLIYVVL